MNRSPLPLGGRRRVAVRAIHGGSLDLSERAWELSLAGALGKLPRDLTEPFLVLSGRITAAAVAVGLLLPCNMLD
jgi:hypothetical protein